MPPARRRGQGTGPTAPQRVSARVRGREALPAIPFTPPTDDEPQCTVCLDDIAMKRHIVFLPCKHQFHWTCGVNWLESRMYGRQQVCPNCKEHVRQTDDHGKTRRFHAFGTMKADCNEYLERRLTQCEQGHIVIATLHESIRDEIANVQAHRESAVLNMRSGEWLEDIDDELSMLQERMKVVDGVLRQYNDAYKCAWENTLEWFKYDGKFPNEVPNILWCESDEERTKRELEILQTDREAYLESVNTAAAQGDELRRAARADAVAQEVRHDNAAERAASILDRFTAEVQNFNEHLAEVAAEIRMTQETLRALVSDPLTVVPEAFDPVIVDRAAEAFTDASRRTSAALEEALVASTADVEAAAAAASEHRAAALAAAEARGMEAIGAACATRAAQLAAIVEDLGAMVAAAAPQHLRTADVPPAAAGLVSTTLADALRDVMHRPPSPAERTGAAAGARDAEATIRAALRAQRNKKKEEDEEAASKAEREAKEAKPTAIRRRATTTSSSANRALSARAAKPLSAADSSTGPITRSRKRAAPGS